MASLEPRSIVPALFLLAVVLSPAMPCEATRLPQRELLQGGPICPACVCCAPPPDPNSCCPCFCGNPSSPTTPPSQIDNASP